jgi:hypothetical protein
MLSSTDYTNTYNKLLYLLPKLNEETTLIRSAGHRNGPLSQTSRSALTSARFSILPSTGAARSAVARQPGRLCVQELACLPRNQTTPEKRVHS